MTKSIGQNQLSLRRPILPDQLLLAPTNALVIGFPEGEGESLQQFRALLVGGRGMRGLRFMTTQIAVLAFSPCPKEPYTSDIMRQSIPTVPIPLPLLKKKRLWTDYQQ